MRLQVYATSRRLMFSSIQLTADISHWVVVCERLLNVNPEDQRLIASIIPNVGKTTCSALCLTLQVHHLHCRIGTTQTSQCAEPDHPAFATEKSFFDAFWKQVAEHHRSSGIRQSLSFVPEYGWVTW